jgi:hypothetical protein
VRQLERISHATSREEGLHRLFLGSCPPEQDLRNSSSFQRVVDYGNFFIELHIWRSAKSLTFATFIYEKAGERLLRHFLGSDENEVIRQALKWCEENS